MEIKQINLHSLAQQDRETAERCMELCRRNVSADDRGIVSDKAIRHSDYLLVDLDTSSYLALSKHFAPSLYDRLFQVRELADGLYIEQLLVPPEHRNRGIAQQLIAKAAGMGETVYCHVSVNDKKSLMLFLRNDFLPIGFFSKDHFHHVKNYSSLLLERRHSLENSIDTEGGTAVR